MKPAMSVLGIDIAQRVFHAVGMDERGKIVFAQAPIPPCPDGFCRNFYLRRFEVSSSSLSNRAS